MDGSKLAKAGRYVALVIGLSFAIFPFFYMFLQSFAPWNQVDRVVFPTIFTTRSYKYLFGGHGLDLPWLRAFLNSLIVSISSTSLMVFTASGGHTRLPVVASTQSHIIRKHGIKAVVHRP